ncbi:hypothetical protein ACFLZ8_06205 [Planctomycetota bacterium]
MPQKQWKKTLSSQRNVFFASTLIIAAIASYNWIVTPHVNYLAAAQRYELATVVLAKKKQTINSDLQIKRKRLEQLQQDYIDSLEVLFDPAEARDFLSNLQFNCEKSGCLMQSLTFSSQSSLPAGKEINENQITTRKANLTFLGGYSHITDLMNALQKTKKKVLIDSVKIIADSDTPGYLRCDMAVSIYIIQRKDEFPDESI